VSVSGDAIQGGSARGSASASYEQMVVIDGGTGAGLLTVVYLAKLLLLRQLGAGHRAG